MCIFRGFSHVSRYLEHLGTWNLKPCEGLQFWPHNFLHRPAALPCPRGQLLSSHPMGHVTCCCRWLKRQQWNDRKRALEIVVENYLTSWKEKQTYFQLPTTNPYQQDEESPSFFAMAALYSEISTSMDLNGKHDVVRTEGRPMCLEPIVHCWHLPPFRSSKTPDQWRDTYAQIVLHSVYHTCSN